MLNPGSLASEYTPSASQCHTSTVAPARPLHAPLLAREMLSASVSAAPGFTDPSVGSLRISDRESFSSTKYGPSVSAGTTMQFGVATIAEAAAVLAAVLDAVALVGEGVPRTAAGAHAAKSAAPEPPSSARISRRVRIRPTGASSVSDIKPPDLSRRGRR